MPGIFGRVPTERPRVIAWRWASRRSASGFGCFEVQESRFGVFRRFGVEYAVAR